MIDHVGFPVSDYERAKAFYAKALAPLGYGLVMEVAAKENPSGAAAAGFGADGKPDFWIGGEGGLAKPLHIAIVSKDRAGVDGFHKAALAAGARDNGAPGLRPHYHPTTTRRSCWITTATTSRPSATRRVELVTSPLAPFTSPHLRGEVGRAKRVRVRGLSASSLVEIPPAPDPLPAPGRLRPSSTAMREREHTAFAAHIRFNQTSAQPRQPGGGP